MGLIFAFLLYQNKKATFGKKQRLALGTIRFLTASILSFLLLSPILQYIKNKEEKPTILFLLDNSASQKYAFKKIDSIAYRKSIQSLSEKLSQDYILKPYSIGERLKDSFLFQYNENSTDLSTALETAITAHENTNLAAVILASDGIYNQGSSPLAMSYPYSGTIYTIGVGDTILQKDALVARVFANKVVYIGDQFAIRSDIAAYGCAGNNLTISVFSHTANRVIASQTVNAIEARFSKSIETIIDARSAGMQRFTITVSKVDGEQNTVNNSQDVVVEVLDNKEKILIVGNSPHPDLYALQEALTKNKNYKVSTTTADKLNASAALDYNLLILHNIPSVTYNASSIIEQAKRLGISIWYIVGSQSAIPLINKTQSAVQISPRGSQQDVQATVNTNFSYFTLPTQRNLTQLPPLSAPFASYSTGPGAQSFLQQKIGSVNTDYPLLILQQQSEGRVALLLGEGLWRWRMYDFLQHKNHNLVDEYITKTAQYLSTKQDRQPFRVSLAKNVYTESEPISFDAELYNNNYELINTPDVSLTIKAEGGQTWKHTLNKNGNSYSLNIGNLAAGKYNYTTSTSFNGKAHTASGNFTVIAQNIEQVNTTADFGMLNQLAKDHNGEFVVAQQLENLYDKIKKNQDIKPIIKSDTFSEPLINWKWLFAALIGLLSLEWFLRKRSGNY